MSDLAASGGYYIAMPAQVIVAHLTWWSIGIFGGKFVTGGVYEKLGAHIDSTSIGKNAGYVAGAAFNQVKARRSTKQLQAFYDQFVEVADSRQRTPEKIDALAQERVWTGKAERAGRRDRRPRSRGGDRQAARQDRRRR